MKSLLVILTRSPHQGSDTQAGLEMALTAASFGMSVSLLLREQSLWLLHATQPQKIDNPAFLDTFHSAHYYDIEPIYVCGNASQHLPFELNYTKQTLAYLDEDEINKLIAAHDLCFTF